MLGFDETIDAYCGQKPKTNPKKYPNAWGHARNCVEANLNILSLYGTRVPYNICRNLEWQVCAALKRLPGQGAQDGKIIFSHAPNHLNPDPRGMKPFGQCRGWRSAESNKHGCEAGFATDDIFFLEVCTFHQICSNGEELFSLRHGEPWTCQLSASGFEKLKQMLLATPDWGEPKGEPPKCEQYCNEWTCGSNDCKGCGSRIRCKNGNG